MSRPRLGPLVLASLAGLLVGCLFYAARFPGNCADSYPPICSNLFGQYLEDWDQAVWWPTLAAGAIAFLIVWAATELIVRRREGRPRPRS